MPLIFWCLASASGAAAATATSLEIGFASGWAQHVRGPSEFLPSVQAPKKPIWKHFKIPREGS